MINLSLSTGEHYRFVWVGDSITAPTVVWQTASQAAITAAYTTGLPPASAPRTVGLLGDAGVRYNARDAAMPIFVNSGVSGNVVADIDAAWLTRIGQYGPTHLVMLIGSNDAAGVPTGVGAATVGATFQASYESVISKTLAAFPKCNIVCCTPPVYFENWPDGVNPRDTAFQDYQARIRNVVTAGNIAKPGQYTLVDMRAAVFAAEPAANPGHLTNSVLFDSAGLHPLDGTGKVVMTNAFMAQVAYT